MPLASTSWANQYNFENAGVTAVICDFFPPPKVSSKPNQQCVKYRTNQIRLFVGKTQKHKQAFSFVAHFAMKLNGGECAFVCVCVFALMCSDYVN